MNDQSRTLKKVRFFLRYAGAVLNIEKLPTALNELQTHVARRDADAMASPSILGMIDPHAKGAQDLMRYICLPSSVVTISEPIA